MKNFLFNFIVLVVACGMVVLLTLAAVGGLQTTKVSNDAGLIPASSPRSLQLDFSNSEIATQKVVVNKAPASFPVTDNYPLCDLALQFPDWYDHLTDEQRSGRALKGYDPRLYCPESKWPTIPEWAK